MAASSKRRQDEKNLKLLRELGSLPPNKQCFDCYQRGPTYLNMTIGSFVCTSCSGILRGLNPPHRVKSISMASFTPDEIEFVKSRGNEYCRREWMGTYDNNPPIETETKDEQRTKDFMAMKYERKRWYVDVTAFRNLPFPTSCSSQHITSPTTSCESKPLSSLLGNNMKHLVVQQNSQNTITRPVMQSASFPPATSSSSVKPAMDLLSDLGGDPFASLSSNSSTTYNANPSFANFDNFVPAFSPRSMANHSASATTSTPVSTPTPQQPPPKDKYAALADLDNLFHSSNNVVIVSTDPNPNSPNHSNSANVDWDHVTGTSNATWGGVNGATSTVFNNSLSNAPTNFTAAPASSNPFTGTSALAPTWNHQNTTSTSTPSPGNPFVSGFTLPGNHINVARATSPSEAFPGNFPGGPNTMMGSYSTGAAGWSTVNQIPTSFTSPTNGNYPSYKMAVAAQFGTWQPTGGNPFMAGTGSGPSRPASSNPFL